MVGELGVEDEWTHPWLAFASEWWWMGVEDEWTHPWLAFASEWWWMGVEDEWTHPWLTLASEWWWMGVKDEWTHPWLALASERGGRAWNEEQTHPYPWLAFASARTHIAEVVEIFVCLAAFATWTQTTTFPQRKFFTISLQRCLWVASSSHFLLRFEYLLIFGFIDFSEHYFCFCCFWFYFCWCKWLVTCDHHVTLNIYTSNIYSSYRIHLLVFLAVLWILVW